MTGRSLSCSPEGIQKAKKALIRFSLTQKALAEELEVTRQPIGKFFTGKPVDRNLFIKICDYLELDWEEVVTQVNEPETEAKQENTVDIDTLVQEVRAKIKPLIQERCGTMRVLDMTQPIGLNDIYTSVNILETITGRQRRGIEELLQQCTEEEDFYRFGMGKITQKRVPGLEAVQKYPKLMILGKPGAGKTTFLKYLAIQCIGGAFLSHCVPIFITLKDFAEAKNQPDLQEYIYNLFTNLRVPNAQVNNFFEHGRAFVLLDGLDEVREEDGKRVINSIRNFSEELFYSEQFKKDSTKYIKTIESDFQKEQRKYYPANKATHNYILNWLCKNFPERYYVNNFLVTCRIAAKEYTFEKFTEVEVADFDEEQISTFATNWFKNKTVKPENFIKHIKDNKPIQELATNPLLLTLLCLAFEESGEFPANRSELYKEGLDALLKKWDAKRGIQREQIYGRLSVQRKEDLLSKIALTTFEKSEYFFKQKAAEKYIIEYIKNLPDASNDPEVLQLDSEKILKSIESQHGLLVERAKSIYSFSHLTFHEYFTAREFVVVKQSSEDALQSLVQHFTEKRWREVCLLALGMSPNADNLLLLMKKKVDSLLADDEYWQLFLTWLNQKITLISKNNTLNLLILKDAYFKIYNFGFEFELYRYFDKQSYLNLLNEQTKTSENFTSSILNLSSLDFFFSKDQVKCKHISISKDYPICLQIEVEIDNSLLSALNYTNHLASDISPNFDDGNSLFYNLNHVITTTDDNNFKRLIRQFKQQIPDPKKDKSIFKTLWKNQGKAWLKKLRNIIFEYRNIGHDWQFSEEQKELLRKYYDANKFLAECLNSDCYVSRDVRQYIEDTLLLPIAEIPAYR